MIRLTLYNDTDVIVNADLIEFVESTPDTLISLTTGKKMMVRECVDDVIGRVIAYRRKISGGRRLSNSRGRGVRRLPMEDGDRWT